MEPCAARIMSMREFHAAVWNIDIERVKKFLRDDPTLVNSRAFDEVPLIWATFRRSRDMLVLLLDNGADPKGKHSNGWTPLQLFTGYLCSDDVKVHKLLLDHGADIDAKNPLGDTALSLAVCWGHTKIVKFLIKRGADMKRTEIPLLSIAAREERWEVIKVLLEHGENPNTKYKGKTASEITENKILSLCLKYYEQYWKEISSFVKDPSLETFALLPKGYDKCLFSKGLLKKLQYFEKCKTQIIQFSNPGTKTFELFLQLRKNHYDRASFAKEFAECLLLQDIEFVDAKAGMEQVLGYLRGGKTQTDAEVVYALFLRADMVYLAKESCSRVEDGLYAENLRSEVCSRVNNLCAEYLTLRKEYFRNNPVIPC